MGMRNLHRIALLSVLVAVVALTGCSDTGTDLDRTVVRFETTLGDFEVQLFDDVTPLTVQNFLGYVEEGAYESSIVHRSVPDFVIQGGGFTTGPTETFPETFPGKVPVHLPVRNEAGLSNVRGTIAMALDYVGDRPLINSATNEWYINLDDNARLDADEFTVFGEIRGDGMDVVDAIAALEIYDLSAYDDALDTIPLSAAPEPQLQLQDLVVILRISVVGKADVLNF
jgi:peptidyl-prolyl cis-trans isomerase A (cyclophilin A)